jgi:hypothetical protein
VAGYYGKSFTRSSGATNKGTASQAMDYLTDDHDSKRMSLVSEGELAYMARINPGYKTNFEGGRIPLMGYGRCEGLSEKGMKAILEASCKPVYLSALGYKTRATEGYKSHVLTLPKELSLLAETDPAKAKAAMGRAIRDTLEKSYPGKEYAAVASIHTRNSNGEIHYHAHILVGKFVKDIPSGKTHSINNASAMGGNARESARMKDAWKRSVEREFHQEMGVTVNQRQDGNFVITTKYGNTIAPLNRVSRREMELRIAPSVVSLGKDGQEYTKPFTLNKMDQKIYEIASQDRGRQGWNRDAFLKAFPKEAVRIERYEARVTTLQGIGYISETGKASDNFKIHAEVKWGNDSPQLAQIRMDLENETKAKNNSALSVPVGTPLQKALTDNPKVGPRIAALGLSPKDIHRAESTWQEQKPRPTKELRELVNAEMDLASSKKKEAVEIAASSSIYDRTAIQDRYARERKGIEDRVEQLRPLAEKSLRHPDFRITKIQFSDIQQDERALARIDSRIQGLETSRADKLKTAETPQAADKINHWHDSRIRPLESTRTKLFDQIQEKHERLLSESETPTQDLSNRFKEKSRYSVIANGQENHRGSEQQSQTGRPINYSRRVGDTALRRVTGHMQGLVKLIRTAMEIREEITKIKDRIPPEKIQDMRRGVDVLTKVGGAEGKALESWRGKESELAARTAVNGKAPAGQVGTLVDHGKARFRNDPLANESYFVRIRQHTGDEKTYWGVNIEKAIKDSGVQRGEPVEIKRTGQDEVSPLRNVLDKSGKVTGQKQVTAQRSNWEVKPYVGVIPPPPKTLSDSTFAAAKEAGRVGTQMNRADKILETNPTPVPGQLKSMELQIQRFNARAEALGIKSPFQKQVLESISPKQLAGVFKEDKALEKLSSGGDAWGAVKSQAIQAAMGSAMKISRLAVETGMGLTKSSPFGG